MPTIIDALSSFFDTSVGGYWAYMYIGIGVAVCVMIIFDNIRK